MPASVRRMFYGYGAVMREAGSTAQRGQESGS
jgi:hypothetical protein